VKKKGRKKKQSFPLNLDGCESPGKLSGNGEKNKFLKSISETFFRIRRSEIKGEKGRIGMMKTRAGLLKAKIC